MIMFEGTCVMQSAAVSICPCRKTGSGFTSNVEHQQTSVILRVAHVKIVSESNNFGAGDVISIPVEQLDTCSDNDKYRGHPQDIQQEQDENCGHHGQVKLPCQASV